MIYHAAGFGALRLGTKIARGREGTVYRVAGPGRLSAKIYPRPDPWLADRLTAAMAQPPARWPAGPADAHRHVAWPRAMIRDAEGRVRGFLMAEVRGVPLLRLYEPDTRADALDDPTWARCVAVAYELATIFDRLHPGIVVGDVSPSNVLVTRSGRVCLIDCDSMQFRDHRGDRIWRARMATPDYAPYTRAGPLEILSPDHDRFGLAILICELLMAGQHPYDGRPVGAVRAEGKAANIRLGANRVTRPGSLGDRPGLIPATMLPENIRQLASEAFAITPQPTIGRPTAAMWMRALESLRGNIATCARSVYHRYPRTAGRCIWCELIRFGDHFPPPSVPRVVPRPPTRKPALRTAPPDYGHRPKPGSPPFPNLPPPPRTWRDR